MNSKIIGAVELDDALLNPELEKILEFGDVKEEYSEYRFGVWKNYVLWNGSGDVNDTLFIGPQGGAVKTAFGRQLEYINSIIETNFHTERIKMVRAMLLRDALIIPHRDYVEFKGEQDSLARVHIPLKTSLECLHSEERAVFHMRKGEVWYLDVSSTHSACNVSESPRISLVIDFQLDGEPLESLLKGEERADTAQREAMLIDREALDEDFLESIAALKHVINRMNYRDIVLLLSRVHFYKDVNQAMLFEWLIEICREHEDESLLEKSLQFKTYMVKDRELQERFFL